MTFSSFIHFIFYTFYFALNTATFSFDRSILSGRMEVFSVDSDVVNPVESEVFDFIASCRVLLTVTFAEKISVPVEAAASPVVVLTVLLLCIS